MIRFVDLCRGLVSGHAFQACRKIVFAIVGMAGSHALIQTPDHSTNL